MNELLKKMNNSLNEFEQLKKEFAKIENDNYNAFLQMEQQTQLRYAFENFRILQNFTTNDFTIKYEDYDVLHKDNLSMTNDLRYHIQNKYNNERYYIEFDLCENMPYIYIICKNDAAHNDFIENK